MSKKAESFIAEEEARAAREFHNVVSRGRAAQKLEKAMVESAYYGDEYEDPLPTFEQIIRRARR